MPTSGRVLRRLQEAEAREVDPWFRDDLRIAWLTVFYASQDQRQPFVLATYRVLGVHPDRLAAALEARRRAQLASFYDLFFPSALPPKKPSTSVSLLERQSKARRS